MTLRRAWFFHFAVALLGVLILALLVAWESASEPPSLSAVWDSFIANVVGGLDEGARDPKSYLLAILGIALLIEVGFAGVAYLIMPWGAGDEPLRASFRHALRRTWLQTPHVVLIIATVGTVAVPLWRANRASRSAYPVPMPEMTSSPPILAYPEGAAPNSQAMKDYEKSMDEYDRAWQAHWRALAEWHTGMRLTQPWYVRFSDAIAVDLGFLSGLWLLGTLLRSAGAPRAIAPIVRPPQCDACGYNLTSIPLESRCPECGEPVAATLGPEARPGSPWQHRREIGRMRAWRRSWVALAGNPARFGRTLRLTSHGADHRRFLVLHLPLIFFIGAVSAPMSYWATQGHSPIPNEPEVIVVGSLVLGTACTIGAVAVTLKAATLASLLWYRQDRRNLMPGAMQATCYLIVYLIAWEIFGAGTGIFAAVLANTDWFNAWALASRIGPGGLATILWFIPNFVCAIWYWTLVRKAVAATRFANR